MKSHEILKDLRKASGLNQDAVAKCLKMSRANYGKKETGTIPLTVDELVTVVEFLKPKISTDIFTILSKLFKGVDLNASMPNEDSQTIMTHLAGVAAYQKILTHALIYTGQIDEIELVAVLEKNIDIFMNSAYPGASTPLKEILKSITGQDYQGDKDKKNSRDLPDWFRGVL